MLTKHGSWSIIAGKTGLAHSRAAKVSANPYLIDALPTSSNQLQMVLNEALGVRMQDSLLLLARCCQDCDIPIVNNESCYLIYR